MRTSDFDYVLPQERIAQTPVEPRDASRLLVLHRSKQDDAVEHRRFRDLTDYLRPGDLMVFNRSRVIPARLYGTESRSGARVEILLVRRVEPGIWQALGRPGRRLRQSAEVVVAGANQSDPVRIDVLETRGNGLRLVRLSNDSALEGLGQLPLPPYIKETPDDPERYQTVYADAPGSVAAPTAGLHFTDAMLDDIRSRGVHTAWVTLHVGLDTFRPVHGEDIAEHKIHTEWYQLPDETANAINGARRNGNRIIAVGTTTVRTLEHVAQEAHNAGASEITASTGDADLFIMPGHQFHLVDAMLTNFHLPRSTLLMLVSAFAGRERILAAYEEAIEQKYRFYSFGDAMLIV
ncbi:MAG: tRNA preQ1(34) S-adenosylmethionine ribosyltransferase-isomerase QueA [Chloroflexi bacterium]|nr:tRNA preQ1(34) S-adenosylmethionine ribosyltransferase-isomerase QueA [Chloroflexota bacterium]MYD48640.1 tRNA preQ1(34) S-adenosylmethionine ribosyltransferase-isomerase QueA [Chloroflexota bacterium]